MGGCASKPKELDGPNSEALFPAESATHISTTPAEYEAPAEVKSEKKEESKEQPLVDFSADQQHTGATAADDATLGELKAEVAEANKEEVAELATEIIKAELVEKDVDVAAANEDVEVQKNVVSVATEDAEVEKDVVAVTAEKDEEVGKAEVVADAASIEKAAEVGEAYHIAEAVDKAVASS